MDGEKQHNGKLFPGPDMPASSGCWSGDDRRPDVKLGLAPNALQKVFQTCEEDHS